MQGKFKRNPNGELFTGAESTKKMELGLITRGISKAAMSFLSSMVADLHYSFGDPPSQPNAQVRLPLNIYNFIIRMQLLMIA